MTRSRRRLRPAIAGWNAAALAVAGSFSLASCGGRAEGSTPVSAPESVADGSSDAADAGPAAIDAAPWDPIDASPDVQYVGGICAPLRLDPPDANADAPDDAEPIPHGGIC